MGTLKNVNLDPDPDWVIGAHSSHYRMIVNIKPHILSATFESIRSSSPREIDRRKTTLFTMTGHVVVMVVQYYL